MKYQKPSIVVYNEEEVSEWAVSDKGFVSTYAASDTCHCSSSGSRVSYSKPKMYTCACSSAGSTVAPTCHCASSGSKVSYSKPKHEVISKVKKAV